MRHDELDQNFFFEAIGPKLRLAGWKNQFRGSAIKLLRVKFGNSIDQKKNLVTVFDQNKIKWKMWTFQFLKSALILLH